jgi:putative transposase
MWQDFRMAKALTIRPDAKGRIILESCTEIPNDMPHWKTVYHYFRLWAKLGVWQKVHDSVRDLARLQHGKKKPRQLRSSTAKAFEQLARPEYVAMMRIGHLQWWSGRSVNRGPETRVPHGRFGSRRRAPSSSAGHPIQWKKPSRQSRPAGCH